MRPFKPLAPPRATLQLDPQAPTVAEVIECLETDSQLSPMRRRDLTSALRRICKIIDRDPARFPADIRTFRRALSEVHPVQAGITEKTLQNIKAGALAALRHDARGRGSHGRGSNLSNDWKELFDKLPGKRLRNGLSRFVRYCSAHGIPPTSVSDEAIDAFVEALRSGSFARHPNDIHRRSTRLTTRSNGSAMVSGSLVSRGRSLSQACATVVPVAGQQRSPARVSSRASVHRCNSAKSSQQRP